MGRDMEQELRALHAGEITGDEFARQTEAHWTRMAKVLHGRWDLPPAVDEEDIRQEMLLAAFEPKPQSGKTLLEKWDPARCAKLSRYVVFNSHADVAKKIHKQREAHRRKGTEEGRFPIAMSSLGMDLAWWAGDDTGLTADAGEGAERMEGRAAAREVLLRVLHTLSRIERVALRVLLHVGGDADAAARAIENSLPLAIATEVGSEQEALVLVERVMGRARDVARSEMEV
jgi:hypothetical protein